MAKLTQYGHAPVAKRWWIDRDAQLSARSPGIKWDNGLQRWHAFYGRNDLGFYYEKADAQLARERYMEEERVRQRTQK